MLFIDGSNLFYDWKKTNSASQLDIEKYINYVKAKHPGVDFIRTYYFVSETTSNGAFLKQINKIPFCQVITGRLQEKTVKIEASHNLRCNSCGGVVTGSISVQTDKGTDVNIAVEMLKHAYNNVYDLAILVSRDADFAGVVKIIKNLGKNVELVLLETSKSSAQELTDTVDDVLVIPSADVYRTGEIPNDETAMTTLLDSLMKRNKQVQNTQLRHHSYLDDDAVIAHAEEASNSDKFKKLYAGDWEELYDSQSDADMALLSILAFWCGCDEEQMDRIFRTSGLMRDKWDRRQAGTTYGAISIRNTVNTCAAVYVPVNAQDIVDEEFTNLDPESKSPEFQPDITKLTLSLDEMAPHTNPRYGRDEIGMGNMARVLCSSIRWSSTTWILKRRITLPSSRSPLPSKTPTSRRSRTKPPLPRLRPTSKWRSPMPRRRHRRPPLPQMLRLKPTARLQKACLIP